MKEFDLQDVACKLQGLSFALDGMVEGLEPYVVEIPYEIKMGYSFASELIGGLIKDVNDEFNRQQKETLDKLLKAEANVRLESMCTLSKIYENKQ